MQKETIVKTVEITLGGREEQKERKSLRIKTKGG
jgi:hypothetical protein